MVYLICPWCQRADEFDGDPALAAVMHVHCAECEDNEANPAHAVFTMGLAPSLNEGLAVIDPYGKRAYARALDRARQCDWRGALMRYWSTDEAMREIVRTELGLESVPRECTPEDRLLGEAFGSLGGFL